MLRPGTGDKQGGEIHVKHLVEQGKPVVIISRMLLRGEKDTRSNISHVVYIKH